MGSCVSKWNVNDKCLQTSLNNQSNEYKFVWLDIGAWLEYQDINYACMDNQLMMFLLLRAQCELLDTAAVNIVCA